MPKPDRDRDTTPESASPKLLPPVLFPLRTTPTFFVGTLKFHTIGWTKRVVQHRNPVDPTQLLPRTEDPSQVLKRRIHTTEHGKTVYVLPRHPQRQHNRFELLGEGDLGYIDCAIAFEWVQTSPNGIECRAECLHPAFNAIFLYLLEDIAEAYPEARDPIAEYIRSVGSDAVAAEVAEQVLDHITEPGIRPDCVQPASAAPEPLDAPQQAPNPWDGIQNPRDGNMVRMWWQGYDKGEIARQFGLDAKTVENRFSDLRRAYGHDVVPLKKDLLTSRK